jgi:hypothetical protein
MDLCTLHEIVIARAVPKPIPAFGASDLNATLLRLRQSYRQPLLAPKFSPNLLFHAASFRALHPLKSPRPPGKEHIKLLAVYFTIDLGSSEL